MRMTCEEWLRVRSAVNAHRYELARRAGEHYPDLPRVARTPLLCRPGWVPERPLPLDALELRWVADPSPAAVTGTEPESAGVRPVREGRTDHHENRLGRENGRHDPGGERYATYTAAMAELAAPAIFEDRPAFRLLDADLRTAPVLSFGPSRYFAGLDVKEALAHELAAGHLGLGPATGLPFRELVGDPCDLRRHPAVAAITTVTVRHDRSAGTAEFLLHRRDPAKVAHGGGLFQVMPVGVFQPLGDQPGARRRDLDLWRCMAREFSEELLGTTEDYGPDFDYGSWPFFGQLDRLRRDGGLAVHILGLGADPLTLAVDLLTVAVFDAAAFDALFRGLVRVNSEGAVRRVPLTDAVPYASGNRPMQAAGAAALALTLRHQAELLPGAAPAGLPVGTPRQAGRQDHDRPLS